MRKVARADIADWQAYSVRRPEVRRHLLEEVRPPRRVHVGEHLTLLFENRETVAYQVQELVRAERLEREADIQQELDTFNARLGDDGVLGFTLVIEIADPDERARLLAAWTLLLTHLYAHFDDGARAYATPDPRQVGAGPLATVHVMKLDTGGRTPVAIGSDWEGHRVEALLSEAQRAALAADLADG
ncbi:MAG: DUF3501 family protein [Deltaproteobacteria bacterium]|nr:MAG: DUF3501 family protein [Deltaproteobacteria bacterium]